MPTGTRSKQSEINQASSASEVGRGRAEKKSAKRVKKSAAQLVDEQLERYRSMRNFSKTKEPAGESNLSADGSTARKQLEIDIGVGEIGPPFVIQKHAATRLHYDFRLGWNGVLKSWAVAKGPSYNPRDRRLAVQVEDHPIEYGGFEGVIPKGQYGGGTVMLWDTGTWKPQGGHTDVDAGLRVGSLKFTLFGSKMHGNWALIRMGGKSGQEGKPNWLLIKEHDDYERSATDICITDESPDSALTGRSLDEIAKSEDHVWNSKETSYPPQELSRKVKLGAEIKRFSDAALASFPREALPKFIPPQLAMQASRPVDSTHDEENASVRGDKAGWRHELKLDGYRVQAHKRADARKQAGAGSESKKSVRLYTRSGLDWTHRMPGIAAAVARMPVDSAIFDGEVVVLADDGTTNFADLQASFEEGANHPLTYFVFDLLHLNGHNLRGAPLAERNRLLTEIISSADASADLISSVIRISEDIETNGAKFFEQACKLGAEGIVSKRSGSRYTSGRSSDWIKVKCIHDQEFVIGGYTVPANGSHGVGALLLGYFDGDGNLIYAGKTGTGFTQKSHRMIRNQLDGLRVERMQFSRMPAAARRNARWVDPLLVAQVNFATWTADHLVRQASFKGLREDKPASEVHLEDDFALSTPVRSGVRHDSALSHAARAQKPPAKEVTSEHPRIRLTHPSKVLDDGTQLTKQQLADYYSAVADIMLLEIARRPLSLVRCPEGSGKPCFFQKHTNAMLPRDIETIEVRDKKTGAMEPYITLSTKQTLVGLAQIGVLEVHPWGSKNDDLEHPDRIILDLDPDESIDWQTLASSAEQLRKLLKSISLESYLKTTGGKGLHLVVPVTPEHDWTAIKQFAHRIALYLEKKQPNLYLSKMSKAARRSRIYVDYLRNERGATAVAALSPRARAGAPVSMPLEWAELKAAEHPIYRVAEFESWKGRLKRHAWKALPLTNQRLDLELAERVLG